MLNSHFRKEAENVPVFRGLFSSEIEFGGQIARILGTSGTIMRAVRLLGGRRFEARRLKWGDEVRSGTRIVVVELFWMNGLAESYLADAVARWVWARFFDREDSL
jgi:hypothetical protein